MLNVVLVEPEIPGNTGNIGRICANIGARLHLVCPLGFDISDRAVKRAGLDYWHLLDLRIYPDIHDFLDRNGAEPLWLATTKGSVRYTDVKYEEECWLLFGRESAGLPQWLREMYPDRCIRIPMRPDNRSINLGNAASILCYEVLRQQGFPNLI